MVAAGADYDCGLVVTSMTRGVAVVRRAPLENQWEDVRDVATGKCDGDDDDAATSQRR
jgi:hypothetical protein